MRWKFSIGFDGTQILPSHGLNGGQICAVSAILEPRNRRLRQEEVGPVERVLDLWPPTFGILGSRNGWTLPATTNDEALCPKCDERGKAVCVAIGRGLRTIH